MQYTRSFRRFASHLGRIACDEAAWLEFSGLLFGVRFVGVGEFWEAAVNAFPR
jgi:hypothetical protein